ncbi:antibiotic biosynthesis monooxygenase family protein [Leucobacter chromiireducens]|uniref:antibiotic biosynthesis monooxygenase family protein n=1 Tax=Leucobacter chromiireducens TaxID=283877 RepID=UPI000F6449C9|nr:hypothetical protein [Leucobacter chromiireducens]
MSASTTTFSSTFIFEARERGDEFFRLDSEIAERARQIPGFLGEEHWVNPETGVHSEVYYWDSREALQQLIGMDTHRLAKRRADEWIGRYRVVIAEVLSSYGDRELGLAHTPLGN